MTDVPTVVSTAEVQIGSLTMRVHHLSYDRRVLDAESLEAFLRGLSDGTLLLDPDAGEKLVEALLHD
jgi:hypothetical protein